MKQQITKQLEQLNKRHPNTKFLLVKGLVSLGDNWHSLEEIKEYGVINGVVTSHLFENLLELSRADFVETDFKEKRYPRQTCFRIRTDCFRVLTEILNKFEC